MPQGRVMMGRWRWGRVGGGAPSQRQKEGRDDVKNSGGGGNMMRATFGCK